MEIALLAELEDQKENAAAAREKSQKEAEEAMMMSEKEIKDTKMRRALETIIFRAQFCSETGKLQEKLIRTTVALWKSRSAWEKSEAVLRLAMTHALAKKEKEFVQRGADHEQKIAAFEALYASQKEALRAQALQEQSELRNEVSRLQGAATSMVEEAQDKADEKVKAYKLQSEGRIMVLESALVEVKGSSDGRINELEADVKLFRRKETHASAIHNMRHSMTRQELAHSEALNVAQCVHAWRAHQRHQAEQEALDSFSRFKIWKTYSDISKARRWFMAKIAAMGALSQARGEHAISMSKLKDVMRQQASDSRQEIDDLEEMVEDQGYIIQDLEDEVRDLAMKLDQASRGTKLEISITSRELDPLCIDGIPVGKVDITASVDQKSRAAKRGQRRPMIKPRPAGKAVVRTGYEEILEKSRHIAQNLLDNVKRRNRDADAGSIIRQAEDLEAKGEAKYEVHHGDPENSELAKDKVAHQRAKRKQDRICKDSLAILSSQIEARRVEPIIECGRVMWEWGRRAQCRIVQRWSVQAREEAKSAMDKAAALAKQLAFKDAEAVVLLGDLQSGHEATLTEMLKEAKGDGLRAYCHVMTAWQQTCLSLSRVHVHSCFCEWRDLTELHARLNQAEYERSTQVSALQGALSESIQRSGDLHQALAGESEARGSAEETASAMADRLRECVKGNIIQVHELSQAAQSALTNSDQLRAQNALQNDALAKTRNEKALAVEALILKKKEADRARRLEKRVESLYTTAVVALETEQGAHEELNTAVLQVHRVVLKVHTFLEDYMKRLHLAGHHAARAEATQGPLGVGGAGHGLSPSVQSRTSLMRWDERMLDQVMRWVSVKLHHAEAAPALLGQPPVSAVSMHLPPFPQGTVPSKASTGPTNRYSPLPPVKDAPRTPIGGGGNASPALPQAKHAGGASVGQAQNL